MMDVLALHWTPFFCVLAPLGAVHFNWLFLGILPFIGDPENLCLFLLLHCIGVGLQIVNIFA